MIPVGCSINSAADVEFDTVNAGLIVGKMGESRNGVNIVILDACRNNPFKGLYKSFTRGLSQMNAPRGTLIAYSTSPNSVAIDGAEKNSPYTKHLMEAMKIKDLHILMAFKRVAEAMDRETGGQQVPWISSCLVYDFFFNPSERPPPPRPNRAVKAEEIPRVSFSLVYPENKDEVGDSVTVSGVATLGSRYKYVFIGTKGDRSNNPNWRMAAMVQVTIDGKWSGTVNLEDYLIDRERDILLKAVLTPEPDSYKPYSFEHVLPRHGDKECVESEQVIIRRIR